MYLFWRVRRLCRKASHLSSWSATCPHMSVRLMLACAMRVNVSIKICFLPWKYTRSPKSYNTVCPWNCTRGVQCAELCSISPSAAQRLDSCSEEGAILVTCISKETNMTVSNDVMRERLCMRAGLPIPSITCGSFHCGAPEGFVDEMNFHLMSGCNKDGCRIANHNAIRDTLIEFCRQAHLGIHLVSTGGITVGLHNGLHITSITTGFQSLL